MEKTGFQIFTHFHFCQNAKITYIGQNYHLEYNLYIFYHRHGNNLDGRTSMPSLKT